jgi:threonylcarbamoyladenosine tRNA methylthiotransferase MtaB
VGCYAQLKPEELAAVDGVDLVLELQKNLKLPIISMIYLRMILVRYILEIADADFYVGSYSIGDRTRAFLKVQDGCDYKCTYCTIPLARGISRSDELNNVLKNAYEISQQNIKEIVLTGVNIEIMERGI